MEGITSTSNQLRAANMVLTLFTCGLWAPVWAFIEFVRWAAKR